MTQLEGYLSVTGPLGCVEIVSSCRAMTYAASSGVSAIRVATGCESCCCPTLDEGYGLSPSDEGDLDRGPFTTAPWWDPTVPDSADFLGIYGTFDLASVDVETASGNITRRRRLTFTGVVLSRCDAGRVYGLGWLERQLTPLCGASCSGVSATVATHCGTPNDGTPLDEVYPNPRPDPSLGARCCDNTPFDPPILGNPPPTPTLVDSGLRTLPDVRYVRDSLVEIPDSEWPSCYGTEVTFSFDVNCPTMFCDEIPVCDLTEPYGNPCCECRTIEFCDDTTEPCSRCGFSCSCDTTLSFSTEFSHPTAYPPDEAALCRWSQPLCRSRVTCITPPVPHEKAAPVITITSGRTAVDLAVTVWEAHPGLPDPSTCAGDDIYADRAPLVPPIQVRVPAESVLTLDGRTGSVNVICDGPRPGDDLVSTCAGTSLELPAVCCEKRMWIAFDADCYQPPGPGFNITVTLAGSMA